MCKLKAGISRGSRDRHTMEDLLWKTLLQANSKLVVVTIVSHAEGLAEDFTVYISSALYEIC